MDETDIEVCAAGFALRLKEGPKRYREILDRIPVGRWGKPEDLAGMYVYLASAASDYVTGFRSPWTADGWPDDA